MIFCWKCGAEIPDGRDRCASCRAPAHRPGLIQRFLDCFRPTPGVKSSPTSRSAGKSVSKTIGPFHLSTNVSTKIVASHLDLRALARKDVVNKDDLLLSPEQLPPDIRAKMEAGEACSLSLDHLPPEIRAKLEPGLTAGLSFGANVDVQTGADISILSRDMPPAIRDKIGSELNSSGQTYTYRDSSGKEHTYHSLEEMPTDVRALIESALRNLPKK